MRRLVLLSVILFNACSSESTDEVVITPLIQKYTLIVNSSEGGSVNTGRRGICKRLFCNCYSNF
jgi:hypothetical protein